MAKVRHLFTCVGLLLALTVSRLPAADLYFVNDHLATTTAVTDAAGEIAAIEADAFGSPVAGTEQAARYTGKPYDSDIGAYVFPYRNYRSEEARWMSADPSGFPDGINSTSYTSSPFTELDPLGLYTETVKGTASFTRSTKYQGAFVNYTALYSGVNPAGKIESKNVTRTGTFFLNGSSAINIADSTERGLGSPFGIHYTNISNHPNSTTWHQVGSPKDGAMAGTSYTAPAARAGWKFDGWLQEPNFAVSSFGAIGDPTENIVRDIGTNEPLKFSNQLMQYKWTAIASYTE